ncbi:hypothetical protein O6H91_01G026400 [Diphasiastrum complanatum]|uniref:Uncharacterized protein n=1 Tax=Diphasiastrum complanatum TaxID=34168 RepID=A0ACC2EP66_DIPCM|nr:hypothetical protein O6H91_01G026400 [Diphasiastrum complanatum]
MAFDPASKQHEGGKAFRNLDNSWKALDGIKNSRGLYQKLVLLFLVVGINIVAFYAFSSFLKGQEKDSRHGYSPDQLELKQLGISSNILIVKLGQIKEELRNTQEQLQMAREDLRNTLDQLGDLTRAHLTALQSDPNLEKLSGFENRMPDSAELLTYIEPRKLPLGWNPSLNSDTMTSSVGHRCLEQKEDIKRFMDYAVGGVCPDDEALAQKLLLAGCEPLPRRRCFAHIPSNFSEPYPIPRCHWEGPPDGSIVWTAYDCKSFECLNTRAKRKIFADCLDCFDLNGREKNRWLFESNQLAYTIQEVLDLKPTGSIRIGLDIGGGTGSFAVRMREHDVTIVTTSLNLGGPFNNFIAQRGVLPFFMTIAQRLPFFDNTLDIVHSMHVLSNWIPTETLEFILMDINRVLRPGGILWLDHFFCLRPQLDIYVPMIKRLGYKKLKWGVGEKLDRGRELQEMYVSAVLEKPLKRS